MAALERAAIYYSANNFNFDGFWVDKASFDLIWALNGGTVDDLRYELFITYFRLVAGEVEVIPEEPIAVYFWEDAMIFSFLDWFIENGADCPTPGNVANWPLPGTMRCE